MNIDAKRIRKLPVTILYYILLMVALSIIASLTREDMPVILNVERGSNFHKRTYNRVETKEFEFVTGMEGQLFWKPKSTIETYILETCVRQGAPFNALNLLYALIFDALLFWMFKNLASDNIFSERVLKGIKYISYFLMLFLAKDILQYHLPNQLLKYFTNGQFKAVFPKSAGYLPYFIAIFILQILPVFISKGQKMEQEQELTV